MIKYFQNRFALTEKGAKDLCRGIAFSTLLNLALMLPPTYLFFFLMEYLDNMPMNAPHTLWFYLLMAAGLMIVMLVVSRWQYDSTYTTVYNESAQRRISLAEKLRRLPLAFFGERNLSDLTATMMEDCTQLETTFSHAIPQLFASVASIVIIAAGMFCYDWRLAIAVFWVVPFALVVLLVSRNRMDKDFTRLYHIKRGVSEQIQEGLECVQEIKSYNGEDEYKFLLVSAMVYNPILEVCNHLAILTFLDVRIKRMKEMEVMPIQTGDTEVEVSNYDIEFHNVSFSYETDKQVLHNVSFTARQGEITALVGSSGGGKSTAAKLAARFWDINSGKITLGGHDISNIEPETLLKNYAVVFQDVMLFNASVADNIRIGRRDATDEEVRHVARLAQCDDFIRRMPHGYDTVIGENGETLSGGERQRISIARALLKDAPVILLDEATASLDAENETKIQTAISELVRNKTVIIIAHRMRTVLGADHIIVLSGGTVMEQGTPDELMAHNGTFAQMVRLQQENKS